MIAAVVMDDHVHLLVRPFAPFSLSKLVHTWKSYSAHQLVKLGMRAPVWQDECYDSIIRDQVHRAAVIEYIRHNPARRWPGIEEYPWLRAPD